MNYVITVKLVLVLIVLIIVSLMQYWIIRVTVTVTVSFGFIDFMETISYHVEFKFTRENKINIVAGESYKLCIKTLKMYFLPKVSVFSNLYYSIFVKMLFKFMPILDSFLDCHLPKGNKLVVVHCPNGIYILQLNKPRLLPLLPIFLVA